jgi:aminoglycoside/choline kinase family phosphotransferase
MVDPSSTARPASAAPPPSPESNAAAPDARRDQVLAWLATLGAEYGMRTSTLRPASNDASFRRYFRLDCEGGRWPTLIVMDAPPPMEDCRPFVHAAQVFLDAGVSVPRVLASDLERGFLLLTDFGNVTYLDRLDERSAPALYADASAALIRIQSASRPGVFPAYDRALLLRELNLFPEWYVARHKGVTLSPADRAVIDAAFEQLLANNLAQPAVYVHRDYHCRNLMVLEGDANPGILDFQDAVFGPITYDLVSLLRDAYVKWTEPQVLDWAIRYWERARRAGLPVREDFGEFYRDFEWMGLQRHLKVLGIFARLYHRDGKDRYLADLPLVLEYTLKALERYNAFGPLRALLDRIEGGPAPRSGYTF